MGVTMFWRTHFLLLLGRISTLTMKAVRNPENQNMNPNHFEHPKSYMCRAHFN